MVYTEPSRERVAAAFLRADWNRRHVYLPLIVATRIIRSRLVRLVRPLFPRYLFVADDERGWGRLRSTPGVMGLVMMAGKPASVEQGSIDRIEKHRRQFEDDTGSPFRRGETVHTAAGVDAIFIESDDQVRARLSVQLFGRSIETWVPLCSIKSATPK